ncbi:TPA: ParB N-terminal domain-containing protein [Stenotrophomonas maltophilia]|nr:ParB N-terminal domain-containing protein [Stenotrophomonas maltophilia]
MTETTLPHARIVPGANPREYFDPVTMAEFEQAIREFGVLEPIIVRPMEDGRFQIVAGERRWEGRGGGVRRRVSDAGGDPRAVR